MAGKKKDKKSKKKDKKAEPKKARVTITGFVMALYKANKSIETQEVIEAVQEKFPKSKVNKAHVGWYRGKARQLGILPEVVRKDKTEKKSKGKKGKKSKSKE